jgi:hypothetical protein
MGTRRSFADGVLLKGRFLYVGLCLGPLDVATIPI